MHVRRHDGRPLRFGHRGWLWENAFLIYDTGTDSLWHHFTGEALSGELRGARLERLPTVQTTWRAWKSEHPGTRVLPRAENAPPRYRRDVYEERNRGLEFGLEVWAGGERVLYPFATLGREPRHDVVGGTPVVIVPDLAARTAHAFVATVDGTVRRFTLESGVLTAAGAGEPRTFRARSGRPVGDGASGRGLHRVPTSHWGDRCLAAPEPGPRRPPARRVTGPPRGQRGRSRDGRVSCEAVPQRRFQPRTSPNRTLTAARPRSAGQLRETGVPVPRDRCPVS